MRLLETLDTLRFEEHQSIAKNKRKSVASTINSRLDKNEQLQSHLEGMLANARSWKKT